MSIRFDDRVAIVTGAGNGLGRSHALLLASRGASVVVNDPGGARDGKGGDHAAADKVVAEIKAAGGKAVANYDSVAERESAASIVKTATDAFGTVDIVVNNAAILRDRSIRKMEEAEWAAVIETNLSGVYHVCREAAERLADGGRIVNMASISGFVGFFGQANYSAAKAGVVGLTKVLSKELARRWITVNAVAPGVVLTEMGKSIPEESRAEMLAQIPLNRFGEPADIAGAILFLCGPLAAYITGQTLHVNGGWYG